MSNIPETQSVLTATDDKSLKVTTILMPKIENQDQVIIKVYSIAQNPTDWKSLELGRIKAGRIVGNDLAGVVVATGSDVTHVSVGDQVPLNMGHLTVGRYTLHGRIH
jgi:NADPH:quinone reductase-like Zn-dependent oxidoreductase